MMNNPLHLLYTAAILALLPSVANAELTGPDSCKAGELAIVESDAPAAWAVCPAQYQTAIYAVEDGTKCVFASPIQGTVTLIAATVRDGSPSIETHVIYNGVNVPSPSPTPEPAPDTLEGVAKLLLAKITGDKKETEKAAIVESLDSVIGGISRGTITTVPGARGTFRGVWSVKAAGVSVDTAQTWTDFLTGVSAKLDYTDLNSVKAGFQTLKDVLKPVPVQPEINAAIEKKKPVSSCQNGECATPQTRNRWR